VPITVHRDEGEWTERQPGVRLKLLHDDGHERSLLLSLAPGAHADFRDPPLDRECLVIEGEAFAGDRLLRAGDYQLAPDGVSQPPSAVMWAVCSSCVRRAGRLPEAGAHALRAG
jgi:hypothetical protein